MKLRKKCKTYGCPNLHTNVSGYCDDCIRKWRSTHQKTDHRPSAAARGYDSRWQKFSRDYLREHPTCAICGAPAKVCDHKDIPADVMMDAYGSFDYDISHYQALCVACNTRKGCHEDRMMREAYETDKRELSAMAQGEGEKN